ncbi:MAG: hypothetical protein E6G79_09040 [Alphaproteobacteria bacterium]|nr:MAG: hypothetical protein E6G79_09040 [Alphaproteobacteria bacterium]
MAQAGARAALADRKFADLNPMTRALVPALSFLRRRFCVVVFASPFLRGRFCVVVFAMLFFSVVIFSVVVFCIVVFDPCILQPGRLPIAP